MEWGRPGSYIQTTTRWQVEDNRKKNDVVFIPVGCTELHGQHLPTAADTLYVSAICEGVRRFTAKRGAPVNLALPPAITADILTITWACPARSSCASNARSGDDD